MQTINTKWSILNSSSRASAFLAFLIIETCSTNTFRTAFITISSTLLAIGAYPIIKVSDCTSATWIFPISSALCAIRFIIFTCYTIKCTGSTLRTKFNISWRTRCFLTSPIFRRVSNFAIQTICIWTRNTTLAFNRTRCAIYTIFILIRWATRNTLL